MKSKQKFWKMRANKNTKSFAIIISLIFFISFYTQRAIIGNIGWNYGQYWVVLSAIVSGLVAVYIGPLLIDTSTRKRGILFLGVYVISLVIMLLFLKYKEFAATDLMVRGVWETKERDGENFMLDFFKEDSLRLIFIFDQGEIVQEQERVMGYKWKGRKLQIYDKEGRLLFDWTVKLDQDRIIISEGEDELTFYKK